MEILLKIKNQSDLQGNQFAAKDELLDTLLANEASY